MNEIKGFTTLLNKNRTQDLSPEFIEFFPTATVIINNDLVVTLENKYFESLTGNSESIVGKNINELFADDKSEKLIDLLKKSFKNSIAYSAEIKIKISDNRLLDVLTIFRSFDDSLTNKKFCVIAFLDFTFQKMKEEVIRDNEARFKNMANTAPVMIWISDVEGLFSFVNRVWLEYSGGELGGQLGMNWLNNVHQEDVQKLLSSYQNALRLRDSFSVEFRFMDKDGNYEWMLIKGKPRFSTENMYMGFIGSCINIQEQKEIEDKISKLNEELIQTISTRDKFFSIISHDLRSPLGGLMGILDVLNS
ncbi:MAG: PAS domain S-box protein, partial [Ignavibacteriaceae bacterium]